LKQEVSSVTGRAKFDYYIKLLKKITKESMPQTRRQIQRQRINYSTRRFETFLTFNIIQSFLEKHKQGLALSALQPSTELLPRLVKQYKKWAEIKMIKDLSCPSCIAIYNNSIFVCEYMLHHILVYDKDTNTRTILHTWGDHATSAGNGIGQFQHPNAIAISKQGIIAVCDTGNNRLQLFETDGTFRIQLTNIQSPCGVAFTHNGQYLAVSDTGNHCIKIYNITGEIINTIGQFGNQREQFNKPYGIAITKANIMFVCDTDNHRIQVFGPHGEYLTFFGENDLISPISISVLKSGEIFVSDLGTKSIKGFRLCNVVKENKLDGKVSCKFFEKQATTSVYGLVVEENGNMIISHNANRCISLLTNFNYHNDGERNQVIKKNTDEEVYIYTIKYGI